jgi:hypothetical protein
MAGTIFIIANTYQFILNRYAVTFVHGRFLGTTGNPHHAAVLLAATIPCLMFLIQGIPKWNFAKFMWGLILLAVIYFLVLTGSRTGVLMGVISVCLFYRNNGGAWFQLLLIMAVIAGLVMPFLEPQTLGSSVIDANVSNRFSDTSNNTRVGVSAGLWQTFSQNILFGAPLEGDRLGYGENSWLSAGATLGLIGFIPMVMMGWESLKLMWQLNLLGKRQPYYFFQCSAVIAGIGSLLIGSCFEAYLLGNLTFSLIAFLTYLLMGAYLIEVDQVRTHYMQTMPRSIDPPGVYQ